jgi:hypothetical protein
VIDFDALVGDQVATLQSTARVLGLDPGAFPAEALSSENRTTGFRSKGFQRIALLGNDKLERVLRRHPEMKRKLRAFYYRLNGTAAREQVPAAVRAELAARYEEPNARLAEQLDAAGIARPTWLGGDASGSRAATGE